MTEVLEELKQENLYVDGEEQTNDKKSKKSKKDKKDKKRKATVEIEELEEAAVEEEVEKKKKKKKSKAEWTDNFLWIKGENQEHTNIYVFLTT